MRVIDLRTHRVVTRYRGGLVRESALLTDGTLVIAHEYGDGRLRFVAPGARRARAAGAPSTSGRWQPADASRATGSSKRASACASTRS